MRKSLRVKTSILLFFLLYSIVLHAQLPETDIFLVKIKKENGNLQFSKPENITNRKGYDNQPSFTFDNKQLLFVSVIDTTQSDVYSYDLAKKQISQITHSRESEYSPTLSQDGKMYTVVRVDADSGQRLYDLPVKKINEGKYIKNSDSVGYYCRLSDTAIAMFVLGKSNTLQIVNPRNGNRLLIASDIGRCMKLNNDRDFLYFVIKGNSEEWFIYRMNTADYKVTRVMKTLSKSEDYALMPDGEILMGQGTKLYEMDNENPKLIADFSMVMSGFYRIAINKDGSLLALVAFIGEKP